MALKVISRQLLQLYAAVAMHVINILTYVHCAAECTVSITNLAVRSPVHAGLQDAEETCWLPQ